MGNQPPEDLTYWVENGIVYVRQGNKESGIQLEAIPQVTAMLVERNRYKTALLSLLESLKTLGGRIIDLDVKGSFVNLIETALDKDVGGS